jgi:hypothetical protein
MKHLKNSHAAAKSFFNRIVKLLVESLEGTRSLRKTKPFFFYDTRQEIPRFEPASVTH